MASPRNPRLIVPLGGDHVREALELARLNQDGFRQGEMEWLAAHNPTLGLHFRRLFEASIQVSGLDISRARLAGQTLGHRAVRLCTGYGSQYDLVKVNFDRNEDVDAQRTDTAEEAWNTEEALNRVFGDQDLTDAFMEIQHEMAVDGAAVTVGFMCLREVPEAV